SELEVNLCAIIQVDLVHVGSWRGKTFGAEVEDPLLTGGVKPEAVIDGSRSRGFIHNRNNRPLSDRDQLEARYHPSRSHRHSIGVAYPELQRDGATHLPYAGPICVYRLKDLVAGVSVAHSAGRLIPGL